jgi:hypothetical protein
VIIHLVVRLNCMHAILGEAAKDTFGTVDVLFCAFLRFLCEMSSDAPPAVVVSAAAAALSPPPPAEASLTREQMWLFRRFDWIRRACFLRDLRNKNQGALGRAMKPTWLDPKASHILGRFPDYERLPKHCQQNIMVNLHVWCIDAHNELVRQLLDFARAEDIDHRAIYKALHIDLRTYYAWLTHDLHLSLEDRCLIDYHVVRLMENPTDKERRRKLWKRNRKNSKVTEFLQPIVLQILNRSLARTTTMTAPSLLEDDEDSELEDSSEPHEVPTMFSNAPPALPGSLTTVDSTTPTVDASGVSGPVLDIAKLSTRARSSDGLFEGNMDAMLLDGILRAEKRASIAPTPYLLDADSDVEMTPAAASAEDDTGASASAAQRLSKSKAKQLSSKKKKKKNTTKKKQTPSKGTSTKRTTKQQQQKKRKQQSTTTSSISSAPPEIQPLKKQKIVAKRRSTVNLFG